MDRLIIGLVAVVTLGACGSGSDDTASGDDATTETTDEATADEATADEATADEATSDEAGDGETADQPDDSETIKVDSLSDVPPECVESFKTFLRDIEPIVSTIDWETATIDDFDQVGTEFEDVAAAFDEDSALLGCDRFDFDSDGQGYDEMIAIARDEAPGSVAFFEFLNSFRQALPGDGETAGAPDTCDEAIAAIESLAEEYGNVSNVPASEIAQFGQISSSLTVLCPLGELETLFEREDLAAFFDG